MKLFKFSTSISYLIVGAAFFGSACGHKSTGATLASSLESSKSVELAKADITIKSYPASTEVTYVDIEVPALNKGSDSVKGELNVWISPSNEPGHLVSFLRTKMALSAGERKTIKSDPSIVRPSAVKNGEPKLYKLLFKLMIDNQEVESFEKEIEVKF